MALINSLLSYDPLFRLSLNEIQMSSWMKDESLCTDEEVITEMESFKGELNEIKDREFLEECRKKKPMKRESDTSIASS